MLKRRDAYVQSLCCMLYCGSCNSRCTHVFATPSLYLDMITTSQDLGLKVTTLQVAAYGGAPCSQNLAQQIKEKLNPKALIVSTPGCRIFILRMFMKCMSLSKLQSHLQTLIRGTEKLC
jgi:acyl-CoA synthetase (AMP-forming)/AMP-acid ligase II